MNVARIYIIFSITIHYSKLVIRDVDTSWSIKKPIGTHLQPCILIILNTDMDTISCTTYKLNYFTCAERIFGKAKIPAK